MVVKKNIGLKFWHCLGTITWACCIYVVSVRAFHLLWRQVQNDSHCDRGLKQSMLRQVIGLGL